MTKLTKILLTCATLSILIFSNQVLAEQEQEGQQYSMKLQYRNAIRPSQIIFEAKPGSEINSTLLAKNLSNIPLTFYVYGADEQKTREGKFGIKLQTNEQTELGKWTTVNPAAITLNGGELSLLDLIVQIPEDLPPKEYLGGLVIEKEAAKGATEGLRIATRIAAKTSITVNPLPFVIPLEAAVYIHPPTWQLLLTKYYFYISLALFIASMIFLSFATRKEKKKKK